MKLALPKINEIWISDKALDASFIYGRKISTIDSWIWFGNPHEIDSYGLYKGNFYNWLLTVSFKRKMI